MRIRIVATPTGGTAPEHIRAEWVGIEVDSLGREVDEPSAERIGHHKSGGYRVSAEVAFAALAKHSPKAHALLTEGASWELMSSILVFDAECCVELT